LDKSLVFALKVVKRRPVRIEHASINGGSIEFTASVLLNKSYRVNLYTWSPFLILSYGSTHRSSQPVHNTCWVDYTHGTLDPPVPVHWKLRFISSTGPTLNLLDQAVQYTRGLFKAKR